MGDYKIVVIMPPKKVGNSWDYCNREKRGEHESPVVYGDVRRFM